MFSEVLGFEAGTSQVKIHSQFIWGTGSGFVVGTGGARTSELERILTGVISLLGHLEH